MFPKIEPRCPLCAAIFCNIEVVGKHLQVMHALRHSGLILARSMWFSPQAFQEVMAVFRDINELQFLNRKVGIQLARTYKQDAETQTEEVYLYTDTDTKTETEKKDTVIEREGLRKKINDIQDCVAKFLAEKKAECPRAERRKVILRRINRLMLLHNDFNSSNVRLQTGMYKLVKTLLNE